MNYHTCNHHNIMLQTSVRYTAADRIRDIIEDNGLLLPVLNRFRVPFGFGNSTVDDICKENDIHCDTFLAVANLIGNRNYSNFQIHLPTLVNYLREAHTYILDYFLPEIRDSLIRGVHQPQLDDAAIHVIKFFDEYMEEVKNHMDFEDEVVFPYIEQLQKGHRKQGFSIKDFATKHNSMASKLNELKDIFLQHYAIPNTKILSRALFNIIACGDDLVSHCAIENKLLVPATELLEKQINLPPEKEPKDSTPVRVSTTPRHDTLSNREIDVIRLVAQGLSNKEIADKLCLSFHTITTYRKNISTKLNIHSSAALTIFAILHNIIDPKQIELK